MADGCERVTSIPVEFFVADGNNPGGIVKQGLAMVVSELGQTIAKACGP